MFLRTLILFLIYLLPCSSAFAQSGSFPYLAEITADQVNIRAGQSPNFERMLRMKKGEDIVVVDRQFSWLKVRLPQSADVYINKKYAQLLDSSRAQVLTDHLNVRALADTNSTILGQLDKGDIVFVKEATEEWLKIQPNSKVFGWIADNYVSFKSKVIPQAEALLSSQEEKIEEVLPVKPAEKLPAVAVASSQLFAKGFLESKQEGDVIQYKITDENQKEYKLKIEEGLIKKFLHYKVFVQGHLSPVDPSAPNNPTLIISNIQLVL